MLEMGFVVALGLLVSMAKLSWRKKLWMTSHTLFMDAVVFSFLTIIHWGSFSGVMIATVGALFCSVTLSLCGWLFGRIESNRYYRGVFDVSEKLVAEIRASSSK
jgi:hypothetical protein